MRPLRLNYKEGCLSEKGQFSPFSLCIRRVGCADLSFWQKRAKKDVNNVPFGMEGCGAIRLFGHEGREVVVPLDFWRGRM